MKTTKHSVLFLAATLATTFSFAQSVIGVTHSANAALRGSVNSAAAQAATRAAANAATRASVQATANARTSVKTDVGIKAQAAAHASENGAVHANENAAMLRTGTTTKGGVTIDANKSEIIDAGAQKTEALNKEADATGTTTIKASEKAKVKVEGGMAAKEAQAIRTAGDVKEDFRAKAQGAVHASETAKANANENAAVVNAKTTTSANAQADKDHVKVSGAAKTSGKVKVAKQ
jgi:hypothetical protein